MSGDSAEAQPAVSMHNVQKRFGDVRAVDGANLALYPGEIHGLLGENGAGKTTLMCLLGGLYQPDGGTLELFGEPCTFRSPRQAMDAGIGMVHQHFMLVPSLTVAENVLLGAAHIPWILRRRKLERQVQKQADTLGLCVDATARVEDLSVGEQQRVEILRVLSRGARVLILDEPTAVLSPEESDALFASLRRLCDQGAAVVLISHKLDEVRAAADRGTVMRRGRVVAAHHDLGRTSASQLAAEMVGRDVSLEVELPEVRAGAAMLSIDGLSLRDDRGLAALRGVELDVCAGEIVGLAGVAGNGQTELFEVVAGLRRADAGTVMLDGRDLAGVSVRGRAELGLRYVPEDRSTTGTSPGLSVRENLLLRTYDRAPCRHGLWFRPHAADESCAEKVEALELSCSGLDQQARLLSGGNIQKLVLARELDPQARLVLAAQPTRGLDAWAASQVRRRLVQARGRQAAVLLCSEDLDELLALSDRVAVMAGGRLVGLLRRDEADREVVGRLMTGAGEGN